MGPQEDGPMEFLWACFSYPGPHSRMRPLWLKSNHCKKVTIHFCTSSLNKPVLYGGTQSYPKACCIWINSPNLSSWLYCLLLFSVTFLLILFTLVIFKETPSLCSLDPLYSLLWLLLNQFRKWDAWRECFWLYLRTLLYWKCESCTVTVWELIFYTDLLAINHKRLLFSSLQMLYVYMYCNYISL